MATKTTTKTSKTATKTEATVTPLNKTEAAFAAVTDKDTRSSGAIAWEIAKGETAYQERVALLGPILAKREHMGTKQADMAREMVEASAGALKLATARVRVSRYVSVGKAIILHAPKNEAELSDVIAKKSAEVRSTKPKTTRGAGTKTGAEKTPLTYMAAVELASQATGHALRLGQAALEAGTLDPVETRKQVASLEAALKSAKALDDLATKNTKAANA